jgi:hypothetical protein
MRMLVIVYGGPRRDLVPALLNECQIGGWTELGNAHGAGNTGRRAGSRVWPGESQVFFSVVEDAQVERLSAALRARKANAMPGERIHVATVPVERFF